MKNARDQSNLSNFYEESFDQSLRKPIMEYHGGKVKSPIASPQEEFLSPDPKNVNSAVDLKTSENW